MTMLECLMLDFQKIMSWKLWINYDSRHVQRRMDRQSEETGAFLCQTAESVSSFV